MLPLVSKLGICLVFVFAVYLKGAVHSSDSVIGYNKDHIIPFCTYFLPEAITPSCYHF